MGLLILAPSPLVGCIPTSDLFCERTYLCHDVPFAAASRATIAVLPFQSVRGVTEEFARLSGERLTGVFSRESRPVIAPARGAPRNAE